MEVKKGEKLAIKGESGTGKTTLFRILLGFEDPSKGGLFFNGDQYSNRKIHHLRKEVAWLPQDLNLGSGKTSEIIDFIFGFRSNKDLKPNQKSLKETLNKLGLKEEILEKKFSDLSTGQRQRVGVAICFLLKKKVLLLDEPTSALDEQSKQKIARLLFREDLTIISTSHDPWWLQQCDRIIELKNQSKESEP